MSSPTWKKYEDAMLRARVISTGVRLTLPGVLGGLYTPEEVSSFAQPRPATSFPALEEQVNEPRDVAGLAELVERVEPLTRDTPAGAVTDAGTVTPTIHERKKLIRESIKGHDPSIKTLRDANKLISEITDGVVRNFNDVTTDAQCTYLEDAVGNWMVDTAELVGE